MLKARSTLSFCCHPLVAWCVLSLLRLSQSAWGVAVGRDEGVECLGVDVWSCGKGGVLLYGVSGVPFAADGITRLV